MPILEDVLKQVDLDEKDAQIYSTLLKNGALTVIELSKKTNQKRTNLYNILKNLENKSLVIKVQEGKTTKYFPNSPREIQSLLDQKAVMLTHTKLNYELLLDPLLTSYRSIDHRPQTIRYEGLNGLKKLYDDVNETGKDILLLRSTFDDKRADVDEIILKQLGKQAKRGINSKVLGPLEVVEEAKALYTKYNSMRLVTQRWVKNFPLFLPAQILIYGNKTAISTIRDEIIITIVDHEDVTKTFRTIFDFMWQYSEAEHNEIIKDWAA